MWRRTYLFLLAVRLWFALSPSYLHPDENFQGPEVIAGKTALSHPCFHVAPLGARRNNVTARLSPRAPDRDSAELQRIARPRDMLTKTFTQARFSSILFGLHGNLRATTRSEASSPYGRSTGFRCSSSGGCG